MKYENIAIILTFFSLWLTSFIIDEYQNRVAFFLIFSIGIFHGSNDLGLIAKLTPTSKAKKVYFYVASYVGTVLIAAAFFYFFPLIALIAFVIFSGYHFGEQHWHSLFQKIGRKEKLFFFIYGYFILSIIFFFNAEDTSEVILSLSATQITETGFLWNAIVSGVLSQTLMLGFALSKKLSWDKFLFQSFLILVFCIVFKVSSLIWAFAIYFILWHSVPSIIEQLKFLYGERSLKALYKYFRASFIVWLISIAGIIGIYFIVLDNNNLFYPIFFALLGAITFAHVFIIATIFGKEQKKADK